MKVISLCSPVALMKLASIVKFIPHCWFWCLSISFWQYQQALKDRVSVQSVRWLTKHGDTMLSKEGACTFGLCGQTLNPTGKRNNYLNKACQWVGAWIVELRKHKYQNKQITWYWLQLCLLHVHLYFPHNFLLVNLPLVWLDFEKSAGQLQVSSMPAKTNLSVKNRVLTDLL